MGVVVSASMLIHPAGTSLIISSQIIRALNNQII